MANVKTFSSVSVRDYTDLGQILLYTTSSQPTTVVYDPNNNTYLPNWATSNLVITPVIQYNGTTLALNASGLVITYSKKEGSAAETSLGTGETVSGGILTVSANKLASISSGLLTYICNVSYTDPEVGVPIETQSSLTYTLISQATELKSAFITGENTFLYDTNKTIVGSNFITLTANLNNVSVTQWQYKKSDGTFAAFPTTHNQSVSGDTLDVYATETGIWLSDRTAVVKLVTNDNDVYDIHEIQKIFDGAAGNATLTAQLSNNSHYVPCDANGNVTSWNGSATQIYIYEGGDDVTSSWTITANPGSGLSGTYNSTTHIFTPSALTDNTSYCDFTCTKTDYSPITVRYTITKSKSGADGQDAVVYTIEPSSLTINKDASGNYTPSTVTFYGYKKIGSALNNSAYSGRFIIEESTDGGNNYTTKYTSSANEASKEWTPSSGVTIIRATLYEAGGTTNALDTQTVVITKDGIKGQDGNDGLNGVSMGLGNYQDVIPCKSDGTTSQAKNITIPFYAYAGIQRIPVTASVTSLPSGITVSTNTPGDATKSGTLVLAVANNSALGNASRITGDITITLSCQYNSQTQSVNQTYTYTKNLKAIDGKNAVIMQIYSEDGGIIQNSSGSTTLKIRLVSGASDVTPTSVQWAKWSSGDYTNISGATNTSLVVTASMVDDLAFFRATASYGGEPYVAYYTVDDLVDPYMSYTFATVQEFKNSQGFGAVYTRVYQNGIEVDPIKSTTFSSTAPSGAKSGDYYYHLDTTNKKCILKKYSGSAWQNISTGSADSDTLNYAYYRQDSNGDPIDTTDAYTQNSNQTRCIYIDPSIINGRMQFICEVTD